MGRTHNPVPWDSGSTALSSFSRSDGSHFFPQAPLGRFVPFPGLVLGIAGAPLVHAVIDMKKKLPCPTVPL